MKTIRQKLIELSDTGITVQILTRDKTGNYDRCIGVLDYQYQYPELFTLHQQGDIDKNIEPNNVIKLSKMTDVWIKGQA